jgi:glycosyltransferase involved in cell wall biosynthesis
MKALIGIATYNRPEKLKRLLKSIEAQTYKDYQIAIVFDNNDDASRIEVMKDFGYLPIRYIVNDKQGYVIGCWNKIHAIPGFDAHLMLVDDVELTPNCLEEAVKAMQLHFPDGDGVVGLTQELPGYPNYTYKPYGQTLMGRKFIDRYKEVNYQVCNPHFVHFYQDEEMWRYMSSLGKTYHSKEAILYHFHPAFKKDEVDDTHKIVRVPSIFKGDIEIFKRRQAEGKLWGKSFDA